MIQTSLKTYRCPLTLTNRAKDKMRELGLEERSFFSLEASFTVYIEKYPPSADRLLSVALFFDNQANKRLAAASGNAVIVLHCVAEKDRFIATNVTARAAHTPVRTNWRRPATITFQETRREMPLDLLRAIHDMPVAKESSDYVKKRIASWEGYLTIQERDADIPDITAAYAGMTFNGDFSRVTLTGCRLKEPEWKLLKDLSVKFRGMDQDAGKVLKASRGAGTVEIELSGPMADRARKQQFHTSQKEVIFSNFATLSQVKRLRQGFKHLEDGLAANPDLERILFEKKPPLRPPKKLGALQFHNRLNEFQQRAVTGAMEAEDLYVIQGPPGTGKTTVISEICLQNARAGLRTLVASQSNLAVDNALGRLLANKDIRILRVGRTESIEEEGKKFIEENVGQYWKDHTLQEVSTQFKARKAREAALEAEWAENEREQERLKPILVETEAAVAAKAEAAGKYEEGQAALQTQKQQLRKVEEEEQSLQKHEEEIDRALQPLAAAIEQDEAFLENEPGIEDIERQWHDLQKEREALQHSVACEELEENIGRKQQAIQEAKAKAEQLSQVLERAEAVYEKASAVKRIDALKWMMLEQNLERSARVLQLLEELDDLRGEMDQITKLKAYNDQLNKAISYMEGLLARYNVPFAELQQRAGRASSSHSADEIDQFLNGLRSALKSQPNLEPGRGAKFLEGLYVRRQSIWRRAKRFRPYEEYKQRAQDAFLFLKRNVIEQLRQKHADERTAYETMRGTIEQQAELDALQQKYNQMVSLAAPVPNAKEALDQQETKALLLEKKKRQLEETQQRLEESRLEQAQKAAEMEETAQKRAQIEAQIKELQNTIHEKEKELAPLEEILDTNPEAEHEEVLKQMASLSFTHESLKQERQRLPLFQSIQGEWLSLLQEASEHDLDEIRKLYVKHANVIGTTCVASARKDFIDNYPVFDVVIIDEVSKATPPELLLPMLKGKKVILVGDHHQLPPLLGNDTLEETLQELAEANKEFAGKTELKGLLEESLFERLFKSVPETNKTMLAIQYRMHESIMETITPFYEREKDRLQCGLPDSDAARDHRLESPLVRRENHLLWIDMPNEPAFFEERMKGGKSLYNPAELREIGSLLKELDEATAQAKEAGRMNADEKKSIGVISFYGEQVKKLNRLIEQELGLHHLTIRTGTVDRFQGMEMDVIILSMVRNHQNKHDDIGFARDYRRLNVALSRARELLVLVGSTTMFTERTKQASTKGMYKHVLDTAKRQNGVRMLEESRG
ncbi:DEAD/DEAH box helicase [Domibacillus robiginosus]|uniref:DEAD/DEAH box helicase n=1 Tax=Domibacillus robiginosus TaxID=1071054 RepID=UPI00067DE278|nr:AAA domain-containing protein [Domibacillus robiginosus]